MLEAEFQANVVQLCTYRGLTVHHQAISLRSAAGWPDLVIVGATGMMFRELKTETGRLSEDQRYWLAILAGAGQDVGVWRPSDWPKRITDELAALSAVQVPRPVKKPRAKGKAPAKKLGWR